jgi:hypothetical protein
VATDLDDDVVFDPVVIDERLGLAVSQRERVLRRPVEVLSTNKKIENAFNKEPQVNFRYTNSPVKI